ncbi:MAG: hypothetical protein HYS18_01855 [Burkholderiales bacterium]|nr:hypothetical protein [Burkholderiales bacterium]
MYLDHPKITATKGDTETDRIDRVNRVYGYAVGIADERGNKEFINKLGRLHDHKGTLIVVWRIEPTEQEKSYLVKAWQSLIGDESTNVEHEMESEVQPPQ